MKKFLRKKRYTDISRLMLEQRKTKEKDEIRQIKKACRIADMIFNDLVKNFKFKKETDIKDFLRKKTHEHGCTFSFEPVVASGRNSSMPHYGGRKVNLRKGFCVLDFGVRYKGYMSDMTRTLYLGKPSKRERQLYKTLLETQKKAIAGIRPGMRVAGLALSVRKLLGKYETNFIHGLGHGIGIEIHELPSITPASKDIFRPNDVFTIEPGIYFKGRLGIRIEDDVLLTKKGPQVLTKARKDLIVIR